MYVMNWGLCSAKCRVQNVECKVQSVKSGVLSAKCKV